jgi:hypothetical protein
MLIKLLHFPPPLPAKPHICADTSHNRRYSDRSMLCGWRVSAGHASSKAHPHPGSTGSEPENNSSGRFLGSMPPNDATSRPIQRLRVFL